MQPLLARRSHGAQHIGRSSASRDSNQHIARLTKCFHLTRETLLVGIIIAHGCQRGGVGRQAYRRQRPALPTKSPNELSRQMLGIRCRATVPTQQQLSATPKRPGNQPGCLNDPALPFIEQRLLRRDRFQQQPLRNLPQPPITQRRSSRDHTIPYPAS